VLSGAVGPLCRAALADSSRAGGGTEGETRRPPTRRERGLACSALHPSPVCPPARTDTPPPNRAPSRHRELEGAPAHWTRAPLPAPCPPATEPAHRFPRPAPPRRARSRRPWRVSLRSLGAWRITSAPRPMRRETLQPWRERARTHTALDSAGPGALRHAVCAPALLYWVRDGEMCCSRARAETQGPRHAR
jgi:hypothetical protein